MPTPAEMIRREAQMEKNRMLRGDVETERDKREALARIQRLEYILELLSRGERGSWTRK